MDEPSALKALIFLAIGLLALALGLGLYLLPILIASHRKHPQTMPIALLTIFGGWTTFLWLGALVWSVISFETRDPQTGALTRSTASGSVIAMVILGPVAGAVLSAFILLYALTGLGTRDPAEPAKVSAEPTAAAATAPPRDERREQYEGDIRARCGRDWKESPLMQESCISREIAAMNSMNAQIENEPKGSELLGIANRCATDWVGPEAPSPSWLLARSCFDREAAAYRRLHAE